MGVYRIGDQRVGVELPPQVIGYSEYEEPIYGDPVMRWVDNACFEIQTPSEQQNMTVTTSEIAWAMLPIVGGIVPAVDEDGEPASIEFFTGGKPTISSSLWLVHNGLRYAMRGDAVLEQDLRGREDHVFCICERQTV
ncbi:hypothetical protein [Mycolicibacterium gilvum]|uniref:hypothetical protein n=1 Tax=Mycolicibacterium gilvum TaxID=1804 RepID=UPI004045E5E7